MSCRNWVKCEWISVSWIPSEDYSWMPKMFPGICLIFLMCCGWIMIWPNIILPYTTHKRIMIGGHGHQFGLPSNHRARSKPVDVRPRISDWPWLTHICIHTNTNQTNFQEKYHEFISIWARILGHQIQAMTNLRCENNDQSHVFPIQIPIAVGTLQVAETQAAFPRKAVRTFSLIACLTCGKKVLSKWNCHSKTCQYCVKWVNKNGWNWHNMTQ